MLDAFTRVMRTGKSQHGLGYIPGLPITPAFDPGIRLRREPDGPVSIQFDGETNLHMPSPFRVGYESIFC